MHCLPSSMCATGASLPWNKFPGRTRCRTEQGSGAQAEFEELAIAEVGLLGSGPYGYSNERMAKHLKEEELGQSTSARKPPLMPDRYRVSDARRK